MAPAAASAAEEAHEEDEDVVPADIDDGSSDEHPDAVTPGSHAQTHFGAYKCTYTTNPSSERTFYKF